MIIIAGDSWGSGEWTRQHTISHGGLGQYLREQGKNVINLSRPGGSNFDCVTRLDDFFFCNPEIVQELEQVYVFQTECIRDFVYNEIMLLPDYQKAFALRIKWFPTHDYNIPDYLENLLKEHLKHFYLTLSDCASKYNLPCKISIIGGAEDTLPDHDKPLHAVNLILKCQSMFNLLANDNPQVDFTGMNVYSSGDNFVTWCKKKFPDLEYLLKSMDTTNERFNHMKTDTTFFKNSHPNRNGHLKLFNFLQDNV